MSPVDHLAQDELLEYLIEQAHHPRHYGSLEDADITQVGGNPSCGDVVTLYLKLDGDRLSALSFTGSGCTISQSAAAILTDLAQECSLEDLLAMDYHTVEKVIGKDLVALRPRCATLALDTLKAAARRARARAVAG